MFNHDIPGGFLAAGAGNCHPDVCNARMRGSALAIPGEPTPVSACCGGTKNPVPRLDVAAGLKTVGLAATASSYSLLSSGQVAAPRSCLFVAGVETGRRSPWSSLRRLSSWCRSLVRGNTLDIGYTTRYDGGDWSGWSDWSVWSDRGDWDARRGWSDFTAVMRLRKLKQTGGGKRTRRCPRPLRKPGK